MRTITLLAAAGAALLISGCGPNETANVTGATEVAPVENLTISDAMVTSIDAPPLSNIAEPATNSAGNTM